mgnify:CR=1 FL=1|jgi:hypothetical protein
MKTVIFCVLASSLPMIGGLNVAEITRAIGRGDADGISVYFDESVELAILDDEDVYSKQVAAKKLKAFFAQYPPRGYSQVHRGTSKSKDSIYCIGNLTTEQAVFRVYIYMRVNGEQHLIQEVRFDKE